MTFGLLLSAAFGASLCLLVFALVPPRPALASAVGRWERQRARQAAVVELEVDDTQLAGPARRCLVAQLAQRGITLGKLRADLELTDYTLEGTWSARRPTACSGCCCRRS